MELNDKRRVRDLKTLISATVAAVPLVLAAGPAFAQESGASVSDEIIVTAQRREQALIDVPISVSVVPAETVRELNLSTFTSVATLAPNFNITQARGGNTVPSLTIRGIRSDSNDGRVNESSVAVYVDDVYLGDESMLSGQMLDVERVEVLRGPQGTLFGRNTTGGLVQFISAAPTEEFSGNASLLYGADNWVHATGAVSGPLGNGARTRLAASFEQHDGHFTNQATLPNAPLESLGAREVWSLRSTTDFDIDPNSSLRLQLTHSETDSQSTPGYGLGIWDPTDVTAPRNVCTNDQIVDAQCWGSAQFGGQPPQSGREAGYATTEQSAEDLAVQQELSSITARFQTNFDWGALISVTNYTTFNSLMGIDGDAASTPSTIGETRLNAKIYNDAQQFSEELRLQGTAGSFDWVAGLFYYQDQKRVQSHARLSQHGWRIYPAHSVERASRHRIECCVRAGRLAFGRSMDSRNGRPVHRRNSGTCRSEA